MMNIQGQRQLQGKLFITANLKLITGMHIGANSDFAPIGAVDSPFIQQGKKELVLQDCSFLIYF